MESGTEAVSDVWHHTTTAGLIGILTSRTIWASSAGFMNDSNEATFADRAIDQALCRLPVDDARAQGIKSILEERGRGSDTSTLGFAARYIACATTKRDSLATWRGYGSGGVAGTFAVGLRNAPMAPVGSAAGANASQWSAVRYCSADEAVAAACETLMGRIAHPASYPETQDLHEVIDGLLASLKHFAFSEEAEARITARHPARGAKVRAGRFGPVPYIELGVQTAAGVPEPAEERERLPIFEVIAWPGAPDQAIDGIAAALAAGGFGFRNSRWSIGNEPRIYRSEIPYI